MSEILDFIKRRFPIDCNWCCQNCYYFCLILKDRFKSGKVFYDVVNGHFVFLYDEKFYDWTGLVEPDGYLVEWKKFDEYDAARKQRIVRDCIM